MINFERMINCIDAHTAGEPLRIITSGLPPIKGSTILEKRKYMLKNYDHIRKMMMLEPRGHAGMYGCIIVPAVTEDGDFGVLFTHNEGLSTMCGHGIIAIAKVVVETGMYAAVEGTNIVRIDSPAGRITAYVDYAKGKVDNVRFENVPSFVYKENFTVPVEGYGDVPAVVGFCGAFYVYIEADKLGLEVCPENVETFIKLGMEIKYHVIDNYEIVHPIESGLNSIYGTIFTGPLKKENETITSKNVCIFADGQVDRSPTGTGTAGRVAILHHNGLLNEKENLVNLSIIDTPMGGKVLGKTKVADFDAVVPEVSGTAFIMGFNQLVLDPEDTLPEGFRLIGG